MPPRVTALTALLNDRDIHDCFILSADPDLVEQARSACPRIHGAVVFGEEDVGTDAKRLQVRNVTNAHQSKVAVLPQPLLPTTSCTFKNA